MLALYRSGRDAEALEAYHAVRSALVDELGIEPRRELRELQQAILNQNPALDLAAPSGVEGGSSRGVFVGRESELAELYAGLDDAFAGRGRLFLLVGEPGIGKSRLAEELIAEARARGARVLVGRCWEAGGAPAYWPWVQSLRAYVREVEPTTLRDELGPAAVDLAQLLPELHELFPGLGEPPSLEPESARFRLFEAATRLLTAASRARPLVLALDDLHAADEPSLLLLQFLARELGSSRLLVVGACRDVDPTPSEPLTAALTELAREPATTVVRLRGLPEEDVARFVEVVSGEPPSDKFVATISAETEGNPLFVGEIVRLLTAEGSLAAAEPARLAIPQSVRDVIARRLGHLSGECNRVLVLASVLGREFGLDPLARMADVAEDELLDTLDEAMAARVVADVPGSAGGLRFAHVLIRDTLYEGLTTARRVRLHRLVVETLEVTADADPVELAHHAIAGADFEKGLEYARRAGDRALGLLAYEEAARLYAIALDALELANPDDGKLRCALVLSLGEAQSRAGDTPEAKNAFAAAAAIATRLGLSVELAHAAAGYAGRVVWVRAGDDHRLVPLLEEALSALGERDVVLRARLLARLSGALRDEHSRDRRDALSARALELARSSGNAEALDYALEGRAYAILAPDTLSDVLALAAELQEVSRSDRERIVAASMLRHSVGLVLGEVRNDDPALAAALAVAEELGQPTQLWLITATRALVALGTGKLREAEKLMSFARELGERALPEGAIPHHEMQRYTLALFRGGVEEVEPGIHQLAAAYPARPVFRCAVAHVHASLRRAADARRVLDALAAHEFATIPFDQEWLFALTLLVEVCVFLSDANRAAELYDLLRPWGGLNAVDPAEGFMGSVWRYLGLLATLLGRTDVAAAHFEDALVANERMGARPWLAYTQHDYAQLLRSRDGPGDRGRAENLLAAARVMYSELGMAERSPASG
jgi:predicted ATPase